MEADRRRAGERLGRFGEQLEVPRPIEQRTEWEAQHEREGAPIYRMLFEKVREPSGPIPTLEMGPTGQL